MTSYLVSLWSISFWLCMPLPKGCDMFVLKFNCEIPRGFGEIKVYTFGYTLFQWARLRISKCNRKCGTLPVGYNFVALFALIILFKNPK